MSIGQAGISLSRCMAGESDALLVSHHGAQGEGCFWVWIVIFGLIKLQNDY